MKRPLEEKVETPPFGRLRYLYVGTTKFEEDLGYYQKVIGAELIWNRSAFGARVAAFRMGDGPLWLLADHRPAGTCIPIFEVDDLKKTMRELRARGTRPDRGPFEIPNGPCCVFRDESGNEFAVFQDERPNVFGD